MNQMHQNVYILHNAVAAGETGMSLSIHECVQIIFNIYVNRLRKLIMYLFSAVSHDEVPQAPTACVSQECKWSSAGYACFMEIACDWGASIYDVSVQNPASLSIPIQLQEMQPY